MGWVSGGLGFFSGEFASEILVTVKTTRLNALMRHTFVVYPTTSHQAVQNAAVSSDLYQAGDVYALITLIV